MIGLGLSDDVSIHFFKSDILWYSLGVFLQGWPPNHWPQRLTRLRMKSWKFFFLGFRVSYNRVLQNLSSCRSLKAELFFAELSLRI